MLDLWGGGIMSIVVDVLKKIGDWRGLPQATGIEAQSNVFENLEYGGDSEEAKSLKIMIVSALGDAGYNRVSLRPYDDLLKKISAAYATWLYGNMVGGVGVFDFSRQSKIAETIDNGGVLKYLNSRFVIVIPSENSKNIGNVMSRLQNEYDEGANASI